MSLMDVLLPKPGLRPGEYRSARAYRGHYCIDPKEDRWIVHDFRVLSGEAEIVPAGSVRVRSFGKPPGYRDLQAYDLRPLSARARVSLEGPYPDGPRRIWLVQGPAGAENKRYVQRLANEVLEPAT